MEEASSSQLIEKIDPDPPRPPKPKTVYFASEGDTHLFLSSPNSLDNEPRIVIFVVSSHAMAPVCDAWAHMVMRHVDRCKLEAETVENVGSAADGAVAFVPLPDDDPDGLEVLLNIAHLRFDRVPEKLKFKRLLAVAVLMEKYGVTQMVRPWWQRWLAAVKDKANVPGYEELLYIAWAFGEEKMLKSGVDHLIRSVRLDEEERLVTPKGVILDFSNENKHFPPYIEGKSDKGHKMAQDSYWEEN
ncbi:hypothetical protein DBV05_g9772 [Lasiodiplodia theobromae]|uniref:BTB domain-containing protein n=1 Tax=Lasiodiplodia theobromae TaxID=45133 RepID=A0A5N5D1J6_9PEZI|nr:hypothetical protein DBV05_g9772 [Lasiodiplodia theobromae]